MKMLTFSSRTAKEILRDPVNLGFGLGFPVALILLLSLLRAAGYLLLFAYNNSPLGAAIGSDNAMYLTMGTALAKGWAPYVDVFDHNGPLLIALQGLPQWIGGGYNLTAEV